MRQNVKDTKEKKAEENDIYYGKNNVAEILKVGDVNKVFIQNSVNADEIKNLAKSKNVPFVFVEKKYLDNLTNNGVHQGVVAIGAPKKILELEELITNNKNVNNPMILILDEVQDPQNLGSILRIIDSFKVNGLVISKRRSAQLTSTVAKVSTGAINHVDIARVNNLRQSLEKLKKEGYWIGYLDMDGETEVSKMNFDIPLAIVVGGEDKGVTEMIKKNSDFGINIKTRGHVNSLNVSSAVSILCYQRSLKIK